MCFPLFVTFFCQQNKQIVLGFFFLSLSEGDSEHIKADGWLHFLALSLTTLYTLKSSVIFYPVEKCTSSPQRGQKYQQHKLHVQFLFQRDCSYIMEVSQLRGNFWGRAKEENTLEKTVLKAALWSASERSAARQ